MLLGRIRLPQSLEALSDLCSDLPILLQLLHDPLQPCLPGIQVLRRKEECPEEIRALSEVVDVDPKLRESVLEKPLDHALVLRLATATAGRSGILSQEDGCHGFVCSRERSGGVEVDGNQAESFFSD